MDVQIHWTYITPKKQQTVLVSDWIDAQEALRLADDFEKTGRTKALEFIDRNGTEWSKKELEKLMKEIESEPHDVVAYFDGGFDHKTAQGGVGAVVYYKQNDHRYRLRANRQLGEIKSNNEAEYAAFWFVMQLLEELGVRHLPVTFRGDSHVVLKQLSGDWPCFEDDDNAWLDRIEAKMRDLGIQPTYEPISRKQNKEADSLARQALDGQLITSRMELTEKG
ncbi:ribonuclease H family protein [Geobacillus subterraneus]|uniref:ribonuclease H family protein n=1 Tax=Geobacillus subterraneus TaxID=129338 RepID=UPI001617757A